jgi:hypothetical protein
MILSSTKAEERQNEHNHDDQTNEINQAVHELSPVALAQDKCKTGSKRRRIRKVPSAARSKLWRLAAATSTLCPHEFADQSEELARVGNVKRRWAFELHGTARSTTAQSTV